MNESSDMGETNCNDLYLIDSDVEPNALLINSLLFFILFKAHNVKYFAAQISFASHKVFDQPT